MNSSTDADHQRLIRKFVFDIHRTEYPPVVSAILIEIVEPDKWRLGQPIRRHRWHVREANYLNQQKFSIVHLPCSQSETDFSENSTSE